MSADGGLTMISELMSFDWYVVLAVLFAIGMIGILILGILYQLLHTRTAANLFDKFFDFATVRFAVFVSTHFNLSDDEKECPEWAVPELWEESLR